ncbi:translation initiation factor IF-2-like [Bubalus bubalis]|uniref:translation initiation factor IF-2-like n=1 Tax=Bubalus bubalis TaxID=89462 RepID=UPI001D126B6E|nr:translation initiation factor IF-2-like [Bubalus bubalis]
MATGGEPRDGAGHVRAATPPSPPAPRTTAPLRRPSPRRRYRFAGAGPARDGRRASPVAARRPPVPRPASRPAAPGSPPRSLALASLPPGARRSGAGRGGRRRSPSRARAPLLPPEGMGGAARPQILPAPFAVLQLSPRPLAASPLGSETYTKNTGFGLFTKSWFLNCRLCDPEQTARPLGVRVLARKETGEDKSDKAFRTRGPAPGTARARGSVRPPTRPACSPALLPRPASARPAAESRGGGAPRSRRRPRAPISSPYEMKFHRGIREEMRPGRSVLLGPPPFLSRGHGF